MEQWNMHEDREDRHNMCDPGLASLLPPFVYITHDAL